MMHYITLPASRCLLGAAILLVITGCAAKVPVVKEEYRAPYTIMGKTYRPLKTVKPGFSQEGTASWYGPGFHGKKTASGEVYDMHRLSAAHNVLPLKTMVKVQNLSNGKEVIVRINDRGPFVNDRCIDLSLSAARGLGMVKPGTAPVRLTVIGSDYSTLASRSPAVDKKEQTPKPPNPLEQTPKPPNPFFTAATQGLLALIK
jgi:rare lipoprotein A